MVDSKDKTRIKTRSESKCKTFESSHKDEDNAATNAQTSDSHYIPA